MAFERVIDILDHAKKFHQALGNLYQQVGVQSGKEKLRILLNYMARHEAHLAECLAGLESDAAKRILHTWFKYPPEMPSCKCFECIDLKPDMEVEEIVEAAMKVDRCLINLYTETAQKAATDEVKDFFRRLLDLEKKEETECLRNALAYDKAD